VGDRPVADRRALPDADRPVGRGQLPDPGRLDDLALDLADDPLGLVVAAVDEQPPRALGDVPADQQDAETQQGAEREGQPPADVDREDVGVQQDQRQRGPGRGRGSARRSPS